MSYENPDDKFSGLSGNAELSALKARCEALTRELEEEKRLKQIACDGVDMWKSQWEELTKTHYLTVHNLDRAKELILAFDQWFSSKEMLDLDWQKKARQFLRSLGETKGESSAK